MNHFTEQESRVLQALENQAPQLWADLQPLLTELASRRASADQVQKKVTALVQALSELHNHFAAEIPDNQLAAVDQARQALLTMYG